MTKPLLALLLASFVLSSCGTRLNPLNWFGNSREVRTSAPQQEVNPLLPQETGSGMFDRPDDVYPGIPIDRITELTVEPVPSGAIVRATGIAARQGAYLVQLTPQTEDGPDENGVMSYTFDVVYPVAGTPVGTEFSRRVSVAQSLSNEDLSRISVIRVVARDNARETRRR
ncbi:hypothetical protein [Thalassococcus sp. S3]|uniref:hypothetical protein n=1 Tax=Thalassococcus sp. S3 TaxID=2017482 RepID=UPI001023F852|nr:hypothetical protein [Thalassococcus sp. S3]QBF32107.1 hypothetical protein CFI11_12870 [Thalassococcus sp. S3]